MKKILLALFIATLSYGKVVTIIDNGVERQIFIPDTAQKKNIKARMVGDSSSAPAGIMVAFKKGAKIDIKNFEKKYNLKLKKKLLIGYYIFNNNSDMSDLELIAKISKNSKTKIKTIRPNWGLHNKAR